MEEQAIKVHLACPGSRAKKEPKENMVTWVLLASWDPLDFQVRRAAKEKLAKRVQKAIQECLRKCDEDTECTVPWMMNTEVGVNQDPQDLLAETDPLDPRVKKVTQVPMASKVTEEIWGYLVAWDPWVYLGPLVNGVQEDLTDPQAYQVKSAPLAKMAKKENVVIWAQWATLVSKVKRVTQVMVGDVVVLALLGPLAAQVTSLIVIKPLQISSRTLETMIFKKVQKSVATVF